MKHTNRYVKNMPDIMLRHDSEEVTKTQMKVHAVVHGTFMGSIPASTIPSLVKNPQLYSLGAAAGASVACIYKIAIETICPSSSSCYQSWADWIVHSAAMNNTTKIIMGVLNSAGVTGNIVAGLMTDTALVALAEGAFAGAIIGKEATHIVADMLCVRGNDTNETNEPDETDPLNRV